MGVNRGVVISGTPCHWQHAHLRLMGILVAYPEHGQSPRCGKARVRRACGWHAHVRRNCSFMPDSANTCVYSWAPGNICIEFTGYRCLVTLTRAHTSQALTRTKPAPASTIPFWDCKYEPQPHLAFFVCAGSGDQTQVPVFARQGL